ncbi:hypothetical protein GJU39_05930 [Pedobacter petrophilus]|uniref:Glycosyltransferase n=1 Tax=Pedobacter petrophilus TaxID=1908241 RepID=A0A7K0FVJ8_9SPHI|nr:hypothetical protein [Pedobacter petrophilus]MRX75623.1 hypothetical protein [Pedobacter petrophilus]
MNFLFISENLPIDTYASEVVFYRHFKKLVENGHSVHILTDQNSYTNRKKDLWSKFKVHILPNRKWYYLPFKPFGILKYIRFSHYYYTYTKNLIVEQKINKLIGYISGNFLMAFAAFVQKKTSLPLISFFHDDTNELNFDDDKKSINHNTIEILNASAKVFIASEAFKTNWSKYSHKFCLLYPIPTDNITSKSIYPKLTNLEIGYSGSVYNEILPSLEKFSGYLAEMNANLTIIGNNEAVYQLSTQYKQVTCLPMFDTAKEANNYLIVNCNICLIAYPENMIDMPWIKTCFPSKFIQYCMLGLPTLIIAPIDSALGKWCTQNSWILYSEKYDIKLINQLLHQALTNEDVAKQVKHLRNKVFNPNILHQNFEETLIA